MKSFQSASVVMNLVVCLQGLVVNGSLPVDLLMEEVVMGGALTPNSVKYVSITSVLRESGLALPRRQTG